MQHGARLSTSQGRLQHDSHASADAQDEALARESRRVVDTAQAPLRSVLAIRHSLPHGSLRSFQPALFVNLTPRRVIISRERQVLSAKRMAAALQALVIVLVHSSRLQKAARPALRIAFWMQLLASKVMRTPMFQSMRFFEWVVEHWECFPPRVVIMVEDLTEKQMSVVGEFFTRPREDPHGWRATMHSSLATLRGRLRTSSQDEQDAFSKCEVGLSLKVSVVSAPSLRWLQRLLDQVAVQDPSTRLCEIKLLALATKRHRAVNLAHVKIIAELLSKNQVYLLHDISLQGMTQRPTHTDQQANMWSIVRAMFRVADGGSLRSVSTIKQSNGRIPRRCASLARNSLSVGHIAAICSSLRYGCVYDEISLASATKLVNSSAERAECWRWIAFGLFYPRSEQFNSAFHLRVMDLSSSYLDDVAMNAFSRTLVNPVTEFRLDGEQTETGGRTIIVCQLKRGSTIYSLPSAEAEPLLTLDRKQSYEALHKESDTEWLNVVVPGYGLGWVHARDIRAQERELLAANSSKIGLVLNWFEVPLATSAFTILMRSIGDRLRSLDLIRPPGQSLDAIYDHCRGLEHLSVANNNLSLTYMRELIGFLQSRAGQRLTSLSPSNTGFNEGDARQLLEALKNLRFLPKLRELSLKHARLTVEDLASLREVLQVRKTLVVLELDKSCAYGVRARFDADFHNERVYVPSMLLACKLAFISVVDRTRRAGRVTERWIFEQIFDFAGQQVQRKLFWR